MACTHVGLHVETALATVCTTGAALVAYAIDGADVVAPGPAGPCRPEQYRGVVLAPWPNRVGGAAFVHDGVRYVLPVSEPATGSSLHGLVSGRRWDVTGKSPAEVTLTYVLGGDPGYPFPIELTARYRLTADGLDVAVVARNAGPRSAPVGLGAHPYLTAGASVDETALHVPAVTVAEPGDRGLPARRHDVAGSPLDHRTPRVIGDARLDHAFTGLAADPDGRARVRLIGNERTVVVELGPSVRWVMVFTADTLEPPARRASVAIEPMTCPPDALRTGEDPVVLPPGGSLALEYSLRVESSAG